MQEESKRKAADLALENKNLKKNKELAAAEYNSLKNKNNSLRVQIAKIVKAKVEGKDDDSYSTHVETPTSTASPTFLHNQSPKAPLVLSTVFPSLDGLTLQSGSQSISGITSQIPMSLGGFKPSDKLESSVMMNTPGTPLYVLSYPWPMQFHAQTNPFHPRPSYLNDQHKTSLVHECSSSTSQTTVNMENHLKETPLKVETKTPDSIDTITRDFLHLADRNFLPDEGASEGSRQLSGLCSKGLVQVTSTSSPFVLPVIARQNESTQQNTPDVKVIYSAVGCVAGAPTEMHQENVTCSGNASASAAAEARKKRKALMKLKSQCCYQFL